MSHDHSTSASGAAGALDPPALPHTRSVIVEGVLQVPGTAPAPTLRYDHPLRKLFVFARHEGLVSAYRKAQAKRLTRRLAARAGVVVVWGRLAGGGTWCAACGRQISPDAQRMGFREEFIFPAADRAEAERVAQELGGRLAAHPLDARRLAEFDHCSGEPAPRLAGLPRTLGESGAQFEPAVRAPSEPQSASVEARRPAGAGKNERRPLVLVGAGDYTYACVLPGLPRHAPFAVVDYNAARAQCYVRKFGFRFAETDYRRVLERVSRLDALSVVVASYHSQHTPIATAFLEANPRASIFIEKPPCVGCEQTRELAAWMERPDRFIEVGFNRRYAPMLRDARERLAGAPGPLVLTCVVRELRLEPSHWYFWASEGTRVYGNSCHWIDLATWLIPAPAVEISIASAEPAQSAHTVAVRFLDGSLFTLIVTDAGDGFRGVQESLDLRAGDTTIVIDDFRRLTLLSHGKTRRTRAWVRDRGHAAMYREFETAVLTGARPQYSVSDLRRTMGLTEEIRQMLVAGERHRLLPFAADRSEVRAG